MATTTSLSSHPAPSTTQSKESAMKTRIMTHMNADHSFSLSLYLRHLCQTPEPQSSPAVLTDITPTYMLISVPSHGTTNMVRFTPPLTSLSETRERVVAMHRAALAALDISDVQITEWRPPNRTWQWTLTLLCVICYPSLLSPGTIHPSVHGVNYAVWSVGGLVPWFAALTRRLALYAWAFMTLAHVAESVYFATHGLRRHRVAVGTGLWWAWVGNCLLSGAGAITRFDGLVREKEEKSEKGRGKH